MSKSRIQIQDSISNSKIRNPILVRKRWTPVWECFLIDMLKSKHLCLLDIKVNSSIVLKEIIIMILQLVDEITVKGVKTHLNIWQLAYW